MTPTDIIETTFADLARTVDFSAVKAAERVPAPLDAVVLRFGAINAEAIRQFGLVSATNLDAVRGLVTVTWTGVSELAEATGEAVEDSAETLRDTGRRSARTARRAGSRIADQAREAARDVERNFSVVSDEAGDVGGRIGEEAEEAAERSVKAADTGTARTSEAGATRPSGPYENWTKDELYDRAQELDIEGRSGMSKNQLLRALRDAS